MDNVDDMIGAIKDGIETNSTDAPAMSMDPKTTQVSVVGDPNKINTTNGDYTITFSYPPDVLSEEDKKKMKLNEETGEYEATIKYEGKRVRPLHRTTVAMDVAEILSEADIILKDGSYTTDNITRDTVRVFLSNVDKMADIAKHTLGIPDSQIEFMTPDTLVNFFVDMLMNEPNIIKESAAFLAPSFTKQMVEKVKEVEKTSKKRSTQQS